MSMENYYREQIESGKAFADGKEFTLANWNKKTKQFHLIKRCNNSNEHYKNILKYRTKKDAKKAGHRDACIVKFGTRLESCYAISRFPYPKLTEQAWLLTKQI